MGGCLNPVLGSSGDADSVGAYPAHCATNVDLDAAEFYGPVQGALHAPWDRDSGEDVGAGYWGLIFRGCYDECLKVL